MQTTTKSTPTPTPIPPPPSTTIRFKQYNVNGSGYARRIRKEEWEQHRNVIRKLESEGRSRQEIRHELHSHHAFHPTQRQLNAQMDRWDLQLSTSQAAISPAPEVNLVHDPSDNSTLDVIWASVDDLAGSDSSADHSRGEPAMGSSDETAMPVPEKMSPLSNPPNELATVPAVEDRALCMESAVVATDSLSATLTSSALLDEVEGGAVSEFSDCSTDFQQFHSYATGLRGRSSAEKRNSQPECSSDSPSPNTGCVFGNLGGFSAGGMANDVGLYSSCSRCGSLPRVNRLNRSVSPVRLLQRVNELQTHDVSRARAISNFCRSMGPQTRGSVYTDHGTGFSDYCVTPDFGRRRGNTLQRNRDVAEVTRDLMMLDISQSCRKR